MLQRPKAILQRVLTDHLRPPRRIAVDEWADAYRFVAEPSPRPGRWRTDDVPYLRAPMRDYTDPAVRRIVLMFAPQCGKTEVLINCLFFSVDIEPYPTLWVMDSQESVAEFNGDRLMDQIAATPRMLRHISGRKWDTKKASVRFDTMTLYFVGANSKGRLASKPVGRLLEDEVDKFPTRLGGRGAPEAGALELAEKRLGAYGQDGKTVICSSPTVEGEGVAAQYARSDQGRFFVPCPHCGGHQPLIFGRDAGRGGVRWPDQGKPLPVSDPALRSYATRVRRQAWYECAHCGGRIEHHHKGDMLRAGLWVRAGQEVDGRGADARVVGDAPESDTRGYWISRLYAPWSSFGDAAAAWIEQRGDVNQDFVNGWLGEPWRTPGTRGEEATVLAEAARQRGQSEALLRSDGAAGRAVMYRKGETSPGALVLLGGIDVQKDGVYWLVAGFGAGRSMWMIDWGFAACPEPGADELFDPTAWAAVEALLRKSWPRVVEREGEAADVHTWAIDSGYRTNEVYDLCLRSGPWVRPVKGQEQQIEPVRYSHVRLAAAAGYPGSRVSRRAGAWSDSPNVGTGPSVELMSIQTHFWKDELLSRLHRTPPQAGAIRYPIDLEDDASDGWGLARQLTAEERVRVRVGRRDILQWRMRPGRRDNHWGDCAVYVIALAESLGLAELTADTAAPSNPLKRAAPAGVKPNAYGVRLGGVRLRG